MRKVILAVTAAFVLAGSGWLTRDAAADGMPVALALPDGAIADPPTARPLRAAAAVSGDGIERATDRLRHHLHRCSVVFIPRAGGGPK